MSIIGKMADLLVARVVPEVTASATGTCCYPVYKEESQGIGAFKRYRTCHRNRCEDCTNGALIQYGDWICGGWHL